MTDNLRDRIAYAIAQADGDEPGMDPASCDYEMADAVIAAVNLKLVNRYGFHRWVTLWEPDDVPPVTPPWKPNE
jgi:hypothetical protein